MTLTAAVIAQLRPHRTAPRSPNGKTIGREEGVGEEEEEEKSGLGGGGGQRGGYGCSPVAAEGVLASLA